MADTMPFQAEVQQLLDLVVHSLYSDREVFLRELISNASDALDRARFLGLSRDDLRPSEGDPGIRLRFDKALGTITVSDNGVGLTRDQAIEHLGTIARSGTKAFAQALREKGDSAEGLIGQFGVGFYASFMVAERVEVHSLSAEPGAEPIRWESTGGASYSVEPGNRSTRGTDVILFLRENATDFADKYRLREIVEKHSQFISYPIEIDDERINSEAALWRRDPREVEEKDYVSFFKHIAGEWQDPLAWVHFRAEAPLEFASILYIPPQRPFDLDYPDAKRGLKLYQQRVMVLEHAEQFVPRYLRFLRGVVDAPDVSLNVSREMVQNTPVVATIKKQIVRRTLRRLKELAAEDEPKYLQFWESFGVTLKEGIAEDGDNRETLAPLLRFRTTKGDGWRDLPTIKAEMVEGQDAIWYISGTDLDRIKSSPQLEAFKKKGWEVIFLSDPVDEWVAMNLPSFETVALKSVARGELPPTDDPIAEEARKQAEPFVKWLGELLGGQVSEVRASRRLTDSPAVLVDGEKGVSANLERILRSARQDGPKAERILEVNPEHALVRKLIGAQAAGRTEQSEPLARLLLDYAQIAEGTLTDHAGFAQRLQAIMTTAGEAV